MGVSAACSFWPRQTGLAKAIDDKLKLLKRHLPYYESDYVLNIAYNILCNGDCLEDIERLRNDEVYLDALGAHRIPDPTTAGDFCRRFSQAEVETLMDTINEVRLGVCVHCYMRGIISHDRLLYIVCGSVTARLIIRD